MIDEEATQEQVDSALTILDETIRGLDEVNKENPNEQERVDKSDLEEIINKANGLNKEKYTKATWDKLVDALNKAKEVLGDEAATQEEVNSSIKNVDDAINGKKGKVIITEIITTMEEITIIIATMVEITIIVEITMVINYLVQEAHQLVQ